MSSFIISTSYPTPPFYFLFIMHPIHSSWTIWLYYTLSLFIAHSIPFPLLSNPPLPSLPSSSLNLEKLSKNIKREKEAQSANVESQREARMKQLVKKHCRSQKKSQWQQRTSNKKEVQKLEMLELEIKEQNAELKSLGKLKESLQVYYSKDASKMSVD